jgi:hypothetical protein
MVYASRALTQKINVKRGNHSSKKYLKNKPSAPLLVNSFAELMFALLSNPLLDLFIGTANTPSTSA